MTAAACGASDPTPAAPATTSAVPAADGGEAAAPGSLFPSVDVSNISDGSTINFQSEFSGGDLPVLLWFWAPH